MTYRVTLKVDQILPPRTRVGSRDAVEEKASTEVLVVVKCNSVDVALSKAIGLAQAEQSDRDARAVMLRDSKYGPTIGEDEEEEEDTSMVSGYPSRPSPRRSI